MSPESPAILPILRALVEEHSGLHYGAADRVLFFDRVSTRAAEAGFTSLHDYYYFLRYDPRAASELTALTEALVVNESYFFRELRTLQLIVKHFLTPVVRAGLRPRVWSAACATGEEPLTLAMLLAQEGLLGDVDIIASDISGRVLERARSGRFPARSVRAGFDAELARSWLKQDGQTWFVDESLVNAVHWQRVNLHRPAEVAAVGLSDVVLCRNVFIYFSEKTVSRVLRSVADSLRPQGALFIGVSESVLRLGTFFTCEERDGVFFYRRAA